jgi:hypothetical protein
MTPAASAGSSSFYFNTWNASPSVSFTVTVTGITPFMSEKQIAHTLTTQASSYFELNNYLFTGVIGVVTDPISGNFQIANTDHIASVFSLSQFQVTQTADTTGATYYIDTCPVLCTVAEAMAYAPLANQLLQSCSGSALTNTQVVDLLAEASADLCGVLRNNIVSAWYEFQNTTNLSNAIKFDNTPIQYFFQPYTMRPTIISLATTVSIFDLTSRYNVDYQTGWCTFKFAQDLLFNYEPFDFNNQWYCVYLAGNYYIPREIKTAVLKLSYINQVNSFIKELSDGVSKVVYETDINSRQRLVYGPIRKYMQ